MDEAKLLKKFAELPEEWREETSAMNPVELKNRISQEVKRLEENDKLWSEDPDVNNLVEQLKTAEAGYKEVRDACRLKIKFAVRELDNKE